MPRHGGNTREVREQLGLGDRPLLDFSASVNPLGPPTGVIDAARRALEQADRYPVPGAPDLVARLAEIHGVPQDRVIVGAGTTELISLLGQCLREVLALHANELGDPRMTLAHLVEPTYTEYRRTARLNNLRLEVWNKPVLGWEQDFLPRSAGGVFWTGHPNNPTGRLWNRDRLLRLVDDTQGLLIVVDEAFLPFLPDEDDRSLIHGAAGRGNLMVLRSLTKFYAMPGLRVGYAVTSADMVTRMRQFQNPWTVTAPAEAAALAALEDSAYRQQTVELIAEESPRMLERLWEIPGLRPAWPSRDRPDDAPPLPNFLLVSLVDTPWTAPQVHDALARRGLLVRECSDFPGLEVGASLVRPDQLVIPTQGHLRFAVRQREENDRLLQALAEVLASEPPTDENA